MPRRVRDPSVNPRDWITRAAEALRLAEIMPDGPQRDEALKKAAHLRTAGELMGALMPDAERSANADARSGAGKSR